MSSTTYHFRDNLKLYAIRKHFVEVNKMVSNVQKMHIAISTHYLRVVAALVRNAGQLPQPFWLGTARGCGAGSAATIPARI